MNIDKAEVIYARRNKYYVGVDDKEGRFAGFIAYKIPPRLEKKQKEVLKERSRVYMEGYTKETKALYRKKMNDLDNEISFLKAQGLANAKRYFVGALSKEYREYFLVCKKAKNRRVN